MAITIKIGDAAEGGETQRVIRLNARKSLEGHIIVRDHTDIDVVINPNDMLVTAYPKDDLHEDVYASQDRLFDFLTKKGVIKRESIAAGNVFASMQGEIPESIDDSVDATQMTLLSVGKWIEDERPALEHQEQYEEAFINSLVDPDDVDSTELGEVPHAEKKGTIDPNNIRRYLGGGTHGYY